MMATTRAPSGLGKNDADFTNKLRMFPCRCPQAFTDSSHRPLPSGGLGGATRSFRLGTSRSAGNQRKFHGHAEDPNLSGRVIRDHWQWGAMLDLETPTNQSEQIAPLNMFLGTR